jgi:hypothetical protein
VEHLLKLMVHSVDVKERVEVRPHYVLLVSSEQRRTL